MKDMINLAPILLVEDDPNDVELTLAALAENNLANEVVVLNDGEEALNYLFRSGKFEGCSDPPPVVVLLDLKMPKVDGIEVLRQIKADVSLRTLPVVVLTSSSIDKDLFEAYKLGANAYVVKPVDFHSFVDTVRKVGVFWAVINEPPPGARNKTQEKLNFHSEYAAR